MARTTNFGWEVDDCEVDAYKLFLADLDAKLGSAYTVYTATLVGGTVTVANTAIKSTNKILYNRSTLGGTPGHLSYAINAGTNIIFTSSSGTDTSTIVYQIV
jgi:hypothetical protein